MFTPSITGCISSFQFSKRGLLPFLLLPHAFLLLYICKFNHPVCIEAAGQKEFPLKKRLSLDQRFWTKMAPVRHPYGALSAKVIHIFWMYRMYKPHHHWVFFHCIACNLLYLSPQSRFGLFGHINAGVTFSLILRDTAASNSFVG